MQVSRCLIVASAIALGACSFVTKTNDLAEPASTAEPTERGDDAGGPIETSGGVRADAASNGPTACADLTNDSRNCGRCGHDCLGGACSGGVCQPLTIASDPTTSPWDIAVDATNVYWTNNTSPGTVMKAPVAGGAATPIATNQISPARIAIDATYAYWTNFDGGTVMRAPLNGGANPTELASGQNQPMGIRVDETNVYWLNSGDGSVNTCTLTNCTLPTAIATNQGVLRTASIDSSQIYFVGDSGNVSSCRKPDCAGGPSVIASGQALPYFVSVYGGTVYWTNGDLSGGIKAYSQAAMNETELAMQQAPRGIAVDASGVYWVTSKAGGSLMTCPLSGCGAGPTMLASNLATPFAVTLDDKAVYFTNSGDGTVQKVAKP
jgi:hypothetical protein